jgi:hypothetical protein
MNAKEYFVIEGGGLNFPKEGEIGLIYTDIDTSPYISKAGKLLVFATKTSAEKFISENSISGNDLVKSFSRNDFWKEFGHLKEEIILVE